MLGAQCYACKEPLREAEARAIVRAPVAPELPGRIESFHARCWLVQRQRQHMSLAVPPARLRSAAFPAAHDQA